MNRQLSFWVVIVAYLCLTVVKVSETSKDKQTDIIFKIEHGPQAGVKVLREGEEETTTTTTTPSPGQSSPETNSSTSLEECTDNNEDRGCCYQFTWPGPHFDKTNEFYGGNFSCPVYLKQLNSKEPCVSPTVLTTKPNGNRPNLTELEQYCLGHSCKIYCRKTNCIKYSYFQNTKNGQQLWNETKFCGNLLSENTGVQVQEGCFKEKLEGFTREVCVCQGHLCNSSPPLLTFTSSLFYSGLFFIMSWIVS